jgi:CRP/FNR family transcriptional regulator, nitrogen fixation regulation protein
MHVTHQIRDTEPVPLELHRGDIVYHQGDPAYYWYEVVSGTVRSCRFLLDGRRQLTGFHFAGDVFGVDQGRCEATADAVCDTVLRRIPRLSWETADADAGSGNMAPGIPAEPHYLHRAYRNAMQFIHLMGHRMAIERISAFLLIIAQRPGDGDVIDLPMSRGDIADHLGLTIHTVSRTISSLVQRRVIATRGRQQICILDRARLAQLAGESDGGPDHAEADGSSPQKPSRAKPSTKSAPTSPISNQEYPS